MKPSAILAIAVVSIWAAPSVLGEPAKPDSKVRAISQEYERLKLEQLVRLNESFIGKFKKRLKEAMKEGDLAAANQADREMKTLIRENAILETRRESADLIASLAGEWELATTRWGFRIHPDGRVTPTVAEGSREGRIAVVDLKERIVRMTGFPTTLTWEVTEGSESLHGTQHPARRVSRKKNRDSK